ncbi:MAG: aldose epimerase family protein, partial [Promethearchaeota archaeon]
IIELLTNHTYWNLEGINSSIDELEIQLFCDKYMITDEKNMVTGEIADMDELGVNLKEPTKISEIFLRFGDLDHNFFLTDYELRTCAVLYSKKSGRKIVVKTTEPCVQVYTGNFMEGLNAWGIICKKHNAICLETQKPPNAVNFPQFRNSVILKQEIFTFIEQMNDNVFLYILQKLRKNILKKRQNRYCSK